MRCLAAVPSGMAHLAEAQPRFCLQDRIAQSCADLERPLPCLDGEIVFAHGSEVLTQVVRYPAEPPLVVENDGKTLSPDEVVERSRELTDEKQRMLQRDAQIDAVLEHALHLREVPEGV